MKITHISKDKLIKIRYESDEGRDRVLEAIQKVANHYAMGIEELK